MTDFFDWLTAVDSGLGADRLRERFRLSEAEMRRATEALTPAFLIALQQMTSDRSAWADFIGRASSAALPGASALAPSGGSPADFAIRLFGSPALAQSVTRQASMMAGIAPDTLAKMMPELGLMTLRTMMQMAGTGAMRPGAMPADTGGQAMAEIMRRSANAVEAFSRPSSEPARSPTASPQALMETLFADALKGGFPWMTGGAARSAAAPKAVPSAEPVQAYAAAFSPFLAFAPLLEAIAAPKGAAHTDGGAAETARQGPEPVGPASGDPLAGLTRAMEAGRAMQETYAQEMLALFDRHRRTD